MTVREGRGETGRRVAAVDEEVVKDRRDPRREESTPPEARVPTPPPPMPASATPIPAAMTPSPPLSATIPSGRRIPVTPPDDFGIAPPAILPAADPSMGQAVSDELPPTTRPSAAPLTPAKANGASAAPEGAAEAAPAARPASERPKVTRDPRLDEIEPLLRAGDWDGILRVLGPPDKASALPPALGLAYAVALREKETPQTESKRGGIDPTGLAIQCTAGLLGVSNDAALALVVAKRLLRRNPVSWNQRPAPRASVSAMIMIAALILGGAIGWMIATGRVRFQF